jgi:hypothetical protein
MTEHIVHLCLAANLGLHIIFGRRLSLHVTLIISLLAKHKELLSTKHLTGSRNALGRGPKSLAVVARNVLNWLTLKPVFPTR